MRPTQDMTWPAPARGWVTAGNITTAPLDAAERLDNFFPTAQGAELRAGYALHATLDDVPRRFLIHRFGDPSTMFAATDSDIYDISSPASSTVTPVASMTGLGSGDWSHIQLANAGGVFTWACNGTDHAVVYDGTNLNPIVDETVIGLAYDALSGAFSVGQTVTGGTSGATAEILAICPTSATAGTLKIGAVTGGPFADNEALTDPVTGAATSNIPSGVSTDLTATVTGIGTAALSQVWVWKERIFAVEKGTQSIWYLPSKSIGGAATEINLGSVFKLGGSVLFGANWSLDGGDGLDDKLVIVTDQGEVAIYAGTDPSSASTFFLEGVYRIGRPLDKHSAFNVGGELMIVMEDGIVSISFAIQRSRDAALVGALTAPIEDTWGSATNGASATSPAVATFWPSQGKLFVGSPTQLDGVPYCLVANTRTVAWCRYTNWDMKSAVVFNDALYFGTSGNLVYQGEVGGTDAGTAYTGILVPKFSNCGTPQKKHVNRIGLVGRTGSNIVYKSRVLREFEVEYIEKPSPLDEPDTPAAWGAGVWGAFIWGQDNPAYGKIIWKNVRRSGYFISPGISVTSNLVSPPSLQVTAIKVRFEIGRAF